MRNLLTAVTSLGLLLFVRPVIAGPVTNLGMIQVIQRAATKTVKAEAKYVFNRDLGQGRMKKTSDGEDGEVRVVAQEFRIGEKLVASKKSEVVTKVPKPAVIEMGRSGFPTSRGSFNRSTVMTVEATAYTPYDGSQTGRTATGRKAVYGVIAVDPRVIPLNSLVYVEGYGFAIAADTGGAIKGHRIDVCFPDIRRVNAWGRKKVVIHVFKEKVGKKE